MTKRNLLFFSLVTTLLTTGSGHLGAQLRDEQLTQQLLEGLPREHRASASAMTPGQAARQAQQKHGGEVLSVEPETQGYRVKVLVDGEVRFVNIAN